MRESFSPSDKGGKKRSSTVRASPGVKVGGAAGVYQRNELASDLASDNCHTNTALGKGSRLLSSPLCSSSLAHQPSFPLSCCFFTTSSPPPPLPNSPSPPLCSLISILFLTPPLLFLLSSPRTASHIRNLPNRPSCSSSSRLECMS